MVCTLLPGNVEAVSAALCGLCCVIARETRVLHANVNLCYSGTNANFCLKYSELGKFKENVIYRNSSSYLLLPEIVKTKHFLNVKYYVFIN